MWLSFLVQGGVACPRQICDPNFATTALIPTRAFCAGEAYCSHFFFSADALLSHHRANPMLPEFKCVHGAPFIYIDLDREDGEELPEVWKRTQALVMCLIEDFKIDIRDTIAYFSGGKGCHVAIRTATWNPTPSYDFCDKAKVFCTFIAQKAGVKIDPNIYDIVRIIRLAWSLHKSGFYKTPLPMDKIFNLKIDEIKEMAKHPIPYFLPPHDGRTNSKLAELWEGCGKIVAKAVSAKAAHENGPAFITQRTLDLVVNGTTEGDRNNRFFEAGANCGEFSTRDALAHGLLLPAAKKSGLSEVEAIRAINNGLRKGEK